MIRVCLIALLFVCTTPTSRAQDLEPNGPWHTAAGDLDSGMNLEAEDLVRGARSELELGNVAVALAMLEQAQRVATDGIPYPPSLRADVEFANGNYAEASAWYAIAAEITNGVERAVLIARAGLAAEESGAAGLAQSFYTRAAAEYPPARAWLDLRMAQLDPAARPLFLERPLPAAARRRGMELQAQYVLSQGDSAAAVSVLTEAGSYWRAAQIAGASGMDGFIGLVVRALQGEGIGPEGERAAELALDLAQRHDDVLEAAAASAVAERRWELALRLTDRAFDGLATARPFMLRGIALENLGRRSEALRAYGRAIELGSEEARYRSGRLLLRMRRYGEGVAALEEFTRSDTNSRFVAPALEHLASRYAASERFAQADSARQLINARFPGTSYGSRARFALAKTAEADGRDLDALFWYGLESDSWGPTRNEARHRAASLLARTGDTLGADSALRELARADSLGFWGMTARQSLGLEPPDFGSPVATAPTPEVARLIAQMDFLDRAGLEVEYGELVEYLVAADGFEPSDLIAVAEALIEKGHPTHAIRLGWRASRDLGIGDVRVVRVVFPWPRRELIEAEASEWGVDPYLVAAIIRQESAFDADATSRAGARGMMQLMPATARWRAGRMGHRWDDSYLGVPDANLHIGVGHLEALLGNYDELVHALAAYNAGGGNLSRWFRNGTVPRSADGFIERIPFPETQGYIRAVTRNIYIYRALYPPTD